MFRGVGELGTLRPLSACGQQAVPLSRSDGAAPGPWGGEDERPCPVRGLGRALGPAGGPLFLCLALMGCAAPWNQSQVTPCLLQCAVTVAPLPVQAAAPAASTVVVERALK